MRQEELAEIILKKCRSDLFRSFPYLDGAVSGMEYRADKDIKTLGTDGNIFYFCPEYILKSFAEQPEKVRKGYLHMLLHCLYLHILPGTGFQERQWSLACDMAVERIIYRELREKRRTAFETAAEKEQCICWIQKVLGKQSASAEQIYVLLEQGLFPWTAEELGKMFVFDDHRRWWWDAEHAQTEGIRKKWIKLGELGGQKKQGNSGGSGTEAGLEREDAGEIGKSRYDYRRFLKQFAVLREEVELDTESFDYIYYSYGLEHYGNLPLIEPLEYKEGHRLEELVIAIDTSGSCSTEMVRQFLRESYAILGEKENFFKKMKVYFIQCDCVIQNVACIRSEQEWKDYCKKLKIQGRAGTDFRPVFRYVQDLREKKELRDLKALIYFTDGDGIYPREAPDYETAFVFVKKTEGMKYVPPWARTLVTEENDGRDIHR